MFVSDDASSGRKPQLSGLVIDRGPDRLGDLARCGDDSGIGKRCEYGSSEMLVAGRNHGLDWTHCVLDEPCRGTMSGLDKIYSEPEKSEFVCKRAGKFHDSLFAGA